MKNVFKAIAAGALGAAFGSCAGSAPAATGRSGVVMADGAREVVVGGHCESSALANALRALGYAVSEADVAGGGGAPSFVYTTGGFPFLGGRSALMRETFLDAAGVPYRVEVPDGDPWSGPLAALDEGRPVPLRVDMRWLPYLYGGKNGPAYMSFGWHWICLFGVDYGRGVAFVSDTALPGLQEIRLADLDRARRSPIKVFPPRAEWVDVARAPAGWRLDRAAVVEASLRAVRGNLAGLDSWSDAASAGTPPLITPTGLAGLRAFPDALRRFESYAKPYLASPALAFLGDCIEKNGTGGAAFRVLFKEFVSTSISALEGSGSAEDLVLAGRLRALLPPLDASVEAWRGLASAFAEASAAAKPPAGPEARRAAYESCALAAGRLADAEAAFAAALD